MKNSKLLAQSTWKSSLLLSLLVLANSACMKPQGRQVDPNAPDLNVGAREEQVATFFNTEVTGTSQISETVRGFSIPTAKLFNVTTCVQDKRTQDRIKGHRFVIRGGEREVQVQSDAQGCLTWPESIHFNFLADSKFLPIKRMIVAQGMHSGAREVMFAINPWNFEGGRDLVDLSRQTVPAEQMASPSDVPRILRGELASGDRATRSLWVDDLRFNIVHNPGSTAGAQVDMLASLTPKVLMRNIRGESAPYALTDGRFRLQFYIMARTDTHSNQCMIIAKTGVLSDVQMTGGRLREEVRLTLKYRNTFGQLELVGRLQAQEGPSSLEPFEATWIMGDHRSLLGLRFADLRQASLASPTGRFDADHYMRDCVDLSDIQDEADVARRMANPEQFRMGRRTAPGTARPPQQPSAQPGVQAPGQPPAHPGATPNPRQAPGASPAPAAEPAPADSQLLPSGISRLEPFEFDFITSRFETILPDETATERTLAYRSTTCVTNPIDPSVPLRDMNFTVVKIDGSEINVRTNHRGCFVWNDQIAHKYYMPEQYMVRYVTIKHSSGFQKRLGVAFNPWDNEGFTFARDIRELQPSYLAQVNSREKRPSQLLLTNFQVNTQRFRYEVDEFLTLKVKKSFLIDISPRVLRYNSITRGLQAHEPIRDGVYLLKVAFQKDYRIPTGDSAEFVSAVRRLVQVRAGKIVTPIEISMRDLRVMRIRNNFLIELATIDARRLTREQLQSLNYEGDLDQLQDPESGLAARTFVGPIVPISNSFSAPLRPTDDLSETYCRSIDCDDLKRTDLVPSAEVNVDSARYFGSVRHLSNKSVTDLIRRKAELDSQYVARMRDKTKLGQMLRESNVEYVSLNNEAQNLAADPIARTNNKVFAPGQGFQQLLSGLNVNTMDVEQLRGRFPPMGSLYTFRNLVGRNPLDPQELRQVVRGDVTISRSLAARLCLVFNERMLHREVAPAAGAPARTQHRAFSDASFLNDICAMSVLMARTPEEAVFVVDRKMRVFETSDYRYLGGRTMNLSVGADFSFGRSKSDSESWSYGWSATSPVLAILKAVPGLSTLHAIADGVGISAGYGRSLSTSQSTNEGFGVSTGTGLSLEIAHVALKVAKHERCGVIRMSPRYIESYARVLFSRLPRDLEPREKLNRLTRGIMICDGAVDETPIVINEQYSYFSQAVNDEVMLDPGDILNHPWMLGLRGRNDFTHFINLIAARKRGPNEVTEEIRLGELPLERLSAAYRSVAPSFPGVLSLDPEMLRGTNLIDTDRPTEPQAR